MKEFVKCTFGGLKTSYLVRQYIFGALIAAVFFQCRNEEWAGAKHRNNSGIYC